MMRGISLTRLGGLTGILLLVSPVIALGAEENGGAHGSSFLGIPLMVWFSIVNFALFVGLLVFLLRKPLANFLRGRKEEVSKEIGEAQRLFDEAEKHHAQVSQRLDQVDQEIDQMRQQLMQEGEAEGERILEQARQASDRLRREADFQAEQEVKMARMSLREEAAGLAVKLAEDLLQKAVTEDDRDRLVNEFLQEVKSK